MRCDWLLLLGALVAGTSTTARAHALLTGSSLERGAPAAHTETPVVLRFNSAIELGLSRVTLVDAAGTSQVLTATRTADQPSHVTVTVPALDPGTYGLRYKIFAVDGHVTENVLRFTITAPH